MMFESFSLPFMQRALVAGILVASLSGYFGVFVVQRGLSFLGDGLAHAAFGGVALALLLNQEPLWIAAPFTILVSLGITWLKDKTKLSADTAVGILFSLSVALGVVFISMRDDYTADAFSYLFGSILLVSKNDLIIITILALIVISLIPLWLQWAYATFDRELAMTDRLPVSMHDYLLSALIAACVVASVKIVGIILVASFLVIPAAGSRMLSRTFFTMTIFSIVAGIFSVVVGLWASDFFDKPSGAVIILVQIVFFFIAMLISKASRN